DRMKAELMQRALTELLPDDRNAPDGLLERLITLVPENFNPVEKFFIARSDEQELTGKSSPCPQVSITGVAGTDGNAEVAQGPKDFPPVRDGRSSPIAIRIVMLAIELIDPNGYNFNVLTPDQFKAYVVEVKRLGRLPKPIVVRKVGKRYVVIDG